MGSHWFCHHFWLYIILCLLFMMGKRGQGRERERERERVGVGERLGTLLLFQGWCCIRKEARDWKLVVGMGL